MKRRKAPLPSQGGWLHRLAYLCVELLDHGYRVIVIDNLINSYACAIRRVEQITQKQLVFYQADICDRVALAQIFGRRPIDATIHFAALKAVGDSVKRPLDYYRNSANKSCAICGLRSQIGGSQCCAISI